MFLPPTPFSLSKISFKKGVFWQLTTRANSSNYQRINRRNNLKILVEKEVKSGMKRGIYKADSIWGTPTQAWKISNKHRWQDKKHEKQIWSILPFYLRSALALCLRLFKKIWSFKITNYKHTLKHSIRSL